MDFRIITDCCRKILTDYPDSPEAEKATELLQEVPKRHQRLAAQTPSEPAVRKSRRLRRRLPRQDDMRRDDERYVITVDEMNYAN